MQRFERSIRHLRFGEPIGAVRAGEIFEVAATNAFGDQLGTEEAFDALMRDPSRSERHHSCVGPIEVSDSPSNASLAVRIRKIRPLTVMSCLSTSTGTLARTFPGRECTFARIQESGRALIHGTLTVQAMPSIGVVSTADEVSRSLGRCAAVGGNLDIPLLQAGTTIYLPVNAPRAQFALGDVHFRQGAGEIPGMGLESDAVIELELDFAEKLPFPIVETPERVAVVGWGDDLLEASRRATENAIAYLGRSSELRSWNPARIYQLLGGCDLIVGNLTGRVATCAIAVSKAMLAEARTRVPIVRAPALLRARVVQPSDVRLAEEAIERFATLPLFHAGNSREIRAIPEHPRVLISCLLDRVYAFEAQGYVDAPGTAVHRAEINGRLSHVLAREGLATSTLATSGPYVLMTAEDVAEHVEVVVKSSLVGDPRHRYPEMLTATTRAGRVFEPSDHECYVRFDWRRAPPHEDVLLPVELADYFIDVTRARATALAAFHVLRIHLALYELHLPDACFFMNKAGDVICGELSPDNMSRLAYIGANGTLRAIINERGKRDLAARWRAIADLLAGRRPLSIEHECPPRREPRIGASERSA
jgi:acetamidase/formamidase